MTSRAPYCEFDAAAHRYFADGVEFPSVTTVLHRAGYINDAWFTDYARWRGSEVHRLTMRNDTTGVDLRTVKPELRGYIRAWRRYKVESGLEFELIEHRVWSFDLRFAGTLDRAKRKLLIVDLKSSTQGVISDWAAIQMAAYGHGLCPGHWFERRGVALKPDGTYRVRVFPASEFGRDLAKFKEALREHDRNTGHD